METVWSDIIRLVECFCCFEFLFPVILTVTYYMLLGKSLSKFISLSILCLLCGLQIHQGNRASPLTNLYSIELSRTVL